MKINRCVLSVFLKTVSVKSFLWLELIISACFVAPTASRAGLYSMGNAYVELAPNGANNTYYGVLADVNTTLLTVSQGDSLYLGGQIQTYTADYGTAATMHYQLNSGSWQTLNLPYNTGNGSSYDQWDAVGGSGNSVNIASLLNYASGGDNNTLTIYYTAYNINDSQSASYDNYGNYFTFDITAVPEPINVALGCFGTLFAGTGVIRFLNSRRFNLATNQPA